MLLYVVKRMQGAAGPTLEGANTVGMQADRSAKTTGRLAALAQAGLAALVAGSLLSFSTIAFRTVFDEPATSGGIDISAPRTAPSAPVVLSTPPGTDQEPTVALTTTAFEAPVIVADAPDTTVLGTRTERPTRTDEGKDRGKDKKDGRRWSFPEGGRTLSGYNGGLRSDPSDDEHKNKTGNGHEKARGNGHHKDQHADDANTYSVEPKGSKKDQEDDSSKDKDKDKEDNSGSNEDAPKADRPKKGKKH